MMTTDARELLLRVVRWVGENADPFRGPHLTVDVMDLLDFIYSLGVDRESIVRAFSPEMEKRGV